VAAALDIYVLGMLFAAIDYPLNLAFYARQNTRLPALVGVISVLFYLVTAWALMETLGFLGLVWADTAKQIGHALIMMTLISWQVGMRREMLGQGTLWILLAGAGAAVVTWLLAMILNGTMAAGIGHDLTLLFVAGSGGIAAYVLFLHWARLPELATFSGWLWQRFGRG
jgi:putative peptidoglycan lipid II flippase